MKKKPFSTIYQNLKINIRVLQQLHLRITIGKLGYLAQERDQ
jgi:hypothetical protein